MQDLTTQSLSLDMINSAEDAICELTSGLDITEEDLELLASSSQVIFDQARHSVEDVAHPRLQWLQQRILMLVSKVELRCLEVMSHADYAASQSLHPIRVQLRDVRVGLCPITPNIAEACEKVLLPAMATCPSFRVRVMTQQTRKNLLSLQKLRQELLMDVSQMLHSGVGRLLNGCHAMLNAGVISMETISPVHQALSDAYVSRSFTKSTVDACRPFFQDLANRHVGSSSSNEMLQELAHQEMLLTVSDRYSIDRPAPPVPSLGHATPAPRHSGATMTPSPVRHSRSQAYTEAVPSGAQLNLHGTSASHAPAPHVAGVPVAMATAAQPPMPVPSYTQSSAKLSAAGVRSADPRLSVPQPPSIGQPAQDWAGQDLLRGLLQNVTRHPPQATTSPAVLPPTQQLKGNGPLPRSQVQQMPVHQAVRPAANLTPHHGAVNAGQNPHVLASCTGQVDPLDLWSLLRDGR